MTFKETEYQDPAEAAALLEGSEEIPAEAQVLDEPAVRHLAAGNSATTLCGVDRSTVSAVHPSKARKDDCAGCREAWRLLKIKKPALTETLPPSSINIKVTPPDEPIFEPGANLCPSCAAGEDRNNLRPAHILHGGHIGEFQDAEGKSKICDCCQPQPKESAEIVPFPEAPKLAEPPPTSARAIAKAQDAADRKKVLALRADGLSYMAIEEAMGWKDQHGNRPWEDLQPRAEEARPQVNERLANLRAAQWRSKQAALCRLCGGKTERGQHYCRRHFLFLKSALGLTPQDRSDILADVRVGKRLDEADAYIKLRENFRDTRLTYKVGALLIGHFTIRRSSPNLYVLRRCVAFDEIEMSRHKTAAEAATALVTLRHELTSHNRFARKALIR